MPLPKTDIDLSINETMRPGKQENTFASYASEMHRRELARSRTYEDRLIEAHRELGKLEGELRGVQSARHEEQVTFNMAMRQIIDACESFREEGPHTQEDALRRVLGIYEIAASYLPAEV